MNILCNYTGLEIKEVRLFKDFTYYALYRDFTKKELIEGAEDKIKQREKFLKYKNNLAILDKKYIGRFNTSEQAVAFIMLIDEFKEALDTMTGISLTLGTIGDITDPDKIQEVVDRCIKELTNSVKNLSI